MSLGDKLKSSRESRGLSQKELANHIGVSTGTIAEWEADETTPNLAELSRLSKALSVSSDVLLEAVAEDSDFTTDMSSAATEPPDIPKQINKYWIIGAVLVIVLAVAVILLLDFQSAVIVPTESSVSTDDTSAIDTATMPTEPLAFSEDTSAIEAADASVVKLFCYDYEGELAATGSGFVAFDGKTIITNYHVMTSAYTCRISTNQDITYDVSKILCYSKDQDIAILQLAKDSGLQPLTLGDSGVIKKGETVVAIGSPLGIKNTVSTGILSGRLMEDTMDVLQFTAPISSGSSGGALFDNNGNVIGVTYASYIDGQNLNLAIPVELAINLYDKKGAAKSVSTICEEEHPHLKYLSEYKNVPVVTLADLKRDPQKYDDKIVRLSIYVSSQGDASDLLDSGNWYLAERNDVSLNFEYDENCNIPGRSGIAYQDSFAISCQTDWGQSKYVDNSVKPGDRIEVVASFNFLQKGEPLFEDDPEGLKCDYDIGFLESILIWKS